MYPKKAVSTHFHRPIPAMSFLFSGFDVLLTKNFLPKEIKYSCSSIIEDLEETSA
jgi:hypothetical protein